MVGKAATVDEYILGFPKAIQDLLEQIRGVIREALPETVETISYRMPTFKLYGKTLVHFAAFANHIGFYPTPSAIEAFSQELRPYKTSRGAVHFLFDRSLPVDLIRRMIHFRANEILSL